MIVTMAIHLTAPRPLLCLAKCLTPSASMLLPIASAYAVFAITSFLAVLGPCLVPHSPHREYFRSRRWWSLDSPPCRGDQRQRSSAASIVLAIAREIVALRNADPSWQMAFHLCGQINQAYALVYVLASSASDPAGAPISYAAPPRHLAGHLRLRNDHRHRSLLVGRPSSGHIRLDVHGFGADCAWPGYLVYRHRHVAAQPNQHAGGRTV